MISVSIDSISFQLGMIEAFCEMVERGLKPLALSASLTPEEFVVIEPLAANTAVRYGLSCKAEMDFPVTSLAPAAETQGKAVILFYKDTKVLKAYESMKQQVKDLQKANKYTPEAQKQMGDVFKALLGYPAN